MSGATLALDIATTTGWALEGTDGYIASGTVSFKNSRYDGGGMRYLRFQRWLEQIDEEAGPIGAVYFEEVRRHVSNDSAQVHGGLLAVLSAWCEDRLVAYQGVPVGTIKRFATGKGNADKAAVTASIFAISSASGSLSSVIGINSSGGCDVWKLHLTDEPGGHRDRNCWWWGMPHHQQHLNLHRKLHHERGR